MVDKPKHAAEAPDKIIGMAKEQTHKPNSGVAFAMTTPRTPGYIPVHYDPQAPRTIERSVKFTHVHRPAVWSFELSATKKQDSCLRLVRELQKREVARILDEWSVDHGDGVTMELQLEELGYMPQDAARLAASLNRRVHRVTLPTADRQSVDAFTAKMGEACLDRLRALSPDELEEQLVAHAFSDVERRKLRRSLQS